MPYYRRPKYPYAYFPNVIRRKFHFNRTFLGPNALSLLGFTLRFRGNSIWDPNYDIGGETIDGWVMWNNLYSQYYVTSSKIRIEITNNEPVAIVIYVVWDLANNRTSIKSLTDEQLRALPNKKRYIIPGVGTGNSKPSTRVFTLWKSTNNLLGVKKGVPLSADVINYTAMGANVGTLNEWIWFLRGGRIDGAAMTANSATINLELLYYTYLQGFKQQAAPGAVTGDFTCVTHPDPEDTDVPALVTPTVVNPCVS